MTVLQSLRFTDWAIVSWTFERRCGTMSKFTEVPLRAVGIVDDPGGMMPPHPVRFRILTIVCGGLEILLGTVLFINGCLRKYTII